MDLQKVYKEDTNDSTIIIRRAVQDDIDALVYLIRKSFPDQLIWCTESQAKKTWGRFIKSEFQEVWVCQYNSEIAAVIRLEKDIVQSYKEIKELRPKLFIALCYLIMRPKILFEKIYSRIKKKYSTDIYYDKDIIKLAQKSIWCHNSAVLAKMRRKGIGSKMMSFCEKRGKELGYDSIKFMIKIKNIISIRCHERLGFIRAGKVEDQYLYIKLLSK